MASNQIDESHNQIDESHYQIGESHYQINESHYQIDESHNQIGESNNQIDESHFSEGEEDSWPSSLADQSMLPLPLFLGEPSYTQDKDLGVKCSFCESVFPKESALQDHIELLHVMKKCPICGESAETMKKLEKHMAEFHEGVKPYQCTDCDAAFSYQRTLKNHIGMVHEGKRPHLCPHCGVSFQTTNALTRHVDRIHEKKKPFKCLMCNYSFAGKGDLKKHILRMHAGKSKPAKNFNCEYCDVKFAQKANLKIHIASVHEGKRHKCSICDKTYATKAILETHVASVHEKSNAFKCTICEATFTTKGTLKYHTQNIHEKPESKSNSENYEINHVELGGHFMSDSTPNVPLLPILDVHKTTSNGHITNTTDRVQTETQIASLIAAGYEDTVLKSYKCSECDEKFSSMKKVQKHFNSVHKGAKYLIFFSSRSSKRDKNIIVLLS